MKKISQNVNELNFSNVAIAIIPPGGGVIYINKQEGLQYHIQYFKELYMYNTYVNSILKSIDFSYYENNPSKVNSDVIPLFQREGCFVYINLSPNFPFPTTWALLYINDSIFIEQKDFMIAIKEKFREIEFFGIPKLNNESMINEECLKENEIGFPNYELLYNFLDSLCINGELKK